MHDESSPSNVLGVCVSAAVGLDLVVPWLMVHPVCKISSS